MYLLVCTRFDISYALNRLSQKIQAPTMNDWHAAIRILRYLKGTKDQKLIYKNISKDKNIDKPMLVGFSDSSWADTEDRRSTNGYCYFYNDDLISWKCAVQKIITLSSTEAEYVALGNATKEGLWLQYLSDEINWAPEETELKIHVDNQSAIKLADNPVFHNRTKHISTRHHFIRELISRKQLTVTHVSTEHNLADLFTKVLATKTFNQLVSYFLFGWDKENSKMNERPKEKIKNNCNWAKFKNEDDQPLGKSKSQDLPKTVHFQDQGSMLFSTDDPKNRSYEDVGSKDRSLEDERMCRLSSE